MCCPVTEYIPLLLGHAFDKAHGSPAGPEDDNARLLRALRSL